MTTIFPENHAAGTRRLETRMQFRQRRASESSLKKCTENDREDSRVHRPEVGNGFLLGYFEKPAVSDCSSPRRVAPLLTARGSRLTGKRRGTPRLRLSRDAPRTPRSRAPASRAFAPTSASESASAGSRKSAKRTRRLASAVGMTASSSLAGAAPAASAAAAPATRARARLQAPRGAPRPPPAARRFRICARFWDTNPTHLGGAAADAARRRCGQVGLARRAAAG